MADQDRGEIRVEVVYAEPDQVFRRALVLPAGSDIGDAVDASDIANVCAGVVLEPDCFGVFGQRLPATHALRDGDRVEIYRPLQANPMDARRRRARKTSA